MRVALYARYSSDLQNERSVDDQLAALRAVLTARGWEEVGVFSDPAVSGAVLSNRPGVLSLLQAAESGAFEAVLVEALDRLSRDQEGTAHIFKRLQFASVVLETISEGRISELHVGLTGTMNQLFLRELGNKTRRGLMARVNAGFSAGGRCYGYSISARGVLQIDPNEAEIIRRIFRAYADGASPKSIAHDLNREAVAGPRGGEWSPSAIYGDRRAHDGILCQELYKGVRLFNKRRTRKHPASGRRSFVLNPPSEWIRAPVPDLRIVDEDLWSVVAARREQVRREPAARHRRPKRLLSGLLRCAQCGSNMTLQGGRYACSAHRERGTCANGKIIAAKTVEAAVIRALGTCPLSTPAVADAVASLIGGAKVPEPASLPEAGSLEQQRQAFDRKIARCKEMYVHGVIEIAELKSRVGRLTAQLHTLQAEAPGAMLKLKMSPDDACRFVLGELDQILEFPAAHGVRLALRASIERVDFHPREGLGKFEVLVVKRERP